MVTKKKTPPPPPDALDSFVALAQKDPKQAIALMLWKQRHQRPELATQVTRKDLEGFGACTAYLNVIPDVRIFRRPEVPARAAVPPSDANPKGVPGFHGAPAAEFVTITMVNKGTEDTFRPIENNEEDAQAADRQEHLRAAREDAPGLAQRVANSAAGGEFSQQLVLELCSYATTLARAAQQT